MRQPVLVLLTAVTLLAAPVANAGSMKDLFDDINFSTVNVATDAELDRPAVDVRDGVTPNGRSLDRGFFTGQIETTSVLQQFAGDSLKEVPNIPIAQSVSAFTFSFDPSTNTYRREDMGLGPIVSDRAQTTGKGKFSLSFSYQYFKPNRFEGRNISRIPLSSSIQQGRVFTIDENQLTTANGSILTVLLDESGGTIPTGQPFEINFPPSPVTNSAGQQVPPPVTCSVRATIFNNPPSNLLGAPCFFEIPGITPGAFEVPPGSGNFVNANAQAIVPDGSALLLIDSPEILVDLDVEAQIMSIAATYGLLDRLDIGFRLPVISLDVDSTVSVTSLDTGCDPLDDACNLAFFQDIVDGRQLLPSPTTTSQEASEHAFGIGDLLLSAKYLALESKWVDLAGRGMVSFPTGDEDDFLGTGNYAGSIGVIASKSYKQYGAHLNVVAFISEDNHESQLRYSLGVDAMIDDWLQVGVDFLARNDFRTDGIGDEIYSIAPGLKVNLWRRLVLTGAAIIRLNDEGLRADVIPSFAIEYTFR